MAIDDRVGDSQPLITVVTVVYNDVNGLLPTIESVLGQDYPNIYYVIVDGGSDDGSLEIIKEHQERIDYWVSEPDDGISDAFNKGIRVSKDKSHVVFLNSGDEFLTKSTIGYIANELKNDIDILSARVITDSSKLIPPFEVTNSSRDYKKLMVAHQGLFVKKEILLSEGGFDEELKVRMDFDFLLRVVGKYKWFYLKEPVVKYKLDGISSLQFDDFWKEGFWVANKNNAPLHIKLEILIRFIFKSVCSKRKTRL